MRLNEVWREKPPYSDRYHLFRLVAHLAKYWTSDIAPQIARWAMEVHGALGVLAEFPVERWFREAMVLTIWEGTCHRQILDGLEVMERKGAHRLLFEQFPNDGLRDAAVWKRIWLCRRRSARRARKRFSASWRFSWRALARGAVHARRSFESVVLYPVLYVLYLTRET